MAAIKEQEFRAMIGRHRRAFAFDKTEIGCADPVVVPPMIIFTVPHVPWNLKPIPVPRAHFSQLLELLQDRLQEQVIERGNGPYANRWFTVPKKNGKLRFQDLQPANKVIIWDAGVELLLEEYVEEFAGRLIYSMGDLVSGYDQFQLERASCDITAIKTPLGLMLMICYAS